MKGNLGGSMMVCIDGVFFFAVPQLHILSTQFLYHKNMRMCPMLYAIHSFHVDIYDTGRYKLHLLLKCFSTIFVSIN